MTEVCDVSSNSLAFKFWREGNQGQHYQGLPVTAAEELKSRHFHPPAPVAKELKWNSRVNITGNSRPYFSRAFYQASLKRLFQGSSGFKAGAEKQHKTQTISHYYHQVCSRYRGSRGLMGVVCKMPFSVLAELMVRKGRELHGIPWLGKALLSRE